MESLKHSVRWDEERFGLELDLDRYMIVAVGDFNMGAMENKGLNIFNTKFVLANPKIATDVDYTNIEAVVAHEYFHNWTGNRVTCQDWFQLSLKEGLTVFRDQEFSADMIGTPSGRAVKRIEDVRMLRQSAISGRCRPDGASGTPRLFRRNQQFLHRHHLRKRRRSRAHVSNPARQGWFPQGHGSLFPAPRRSSRDLRRFPRRDGRCQRTRSRAIRALVQPGWHAARQGKHTL